MSDGMLHDILEIERQIEADLAAERAKATSWLADQKAEIDRQAEQEIEKATLSAARTGDGRCQTARAAGADRIREMRRHVRRLKFIPEEILRQIVQRHHLQLFGGVHHDHPDDQN